MARGARAATLALGILLATTARAGADVCVSASARFLNLTPEPGFVRAMQHEVSSIWEPYGVHVEWGTDDGRCVRSDGSFDVMIVRRLQTVMKSGGPVLASTHIPVAAIDRLPVLVDYDATERHVVSLSHERLKSLTGFPVPGRVELGRAVGRLLAHEIGHVLLAAPDHQPRGLMRPGFAPADLVGPERRSFTLSRAEQLRLRYREDALRLAAGAAPGWRPGSE